MKTTQPKTEYILRRIAELKETQHISRTLLAVCPNSMAVIKAAFRSAKRNNAPIKFAATLNQVDCDGGYTGMTQSVFTDVLRMESRAVDYTGPYIVAVDHGGPWLKDIQSVEKWDTDRAMAAVKKSFEAAVAAGYDLIHVDPTVDIHVPKGEIIDIHLVAKRTVELIEHTETFRRSNGFPPVSYEVGTDLHTVTFDKEVARKLTAKVAKFGSYIKGHYTDGVLNPEDYPLCGMGAANVGPEFTISEYDALMELEGIEKRLHAEGRVAVCSDMKNVLWKLVDESNRWRKWLLESEKGHHFNELSEERKLWLVRTSCRYIWQKPEAIVARNQLYENLNRNGYESEDIVLMRIEHDMDKYFNAFNLVNLNDYLL